MVERTITEPFNFGRTILQYCLILLVCLCIVAPPIDTGGTLPFIRFEEMLLPVFFVLYAWFLMVGCVPMFRLNPMFFVAISFTFSVLLSIWYGAVVLDQNVVLRDFFEVPKLWFPVAFFTMAYETKFTQRVLTRLLYAYGFTVMLVCVYAWAQWIGLPFTQTLNAYYSAGVHDEALYLTKRVYSTMGNPNVLGLLLSWAVVCCALALLANVGSRLWNGIILVSSAVTIAMTASRSGVLSATIGLLIALLLTAGSSTNRKRAVQLGIFASFLAVLAVVAVVVVQTNPHAVTRYEELKHPGQVDSLRERFDDLWLDALSDFAQSPLLGYGPAKLRFGNIVTDSEYLDVLKQFGLLGFAAYLGFFLYPLSQLWKGVRATKHVPNYLEPQLRIHILVVRFAFVMLLLTFLINIVATTFYSLFLQGFLWLWFGIGVRSSRTILENLGVVRAQASQFPAANISAAGFDQLQFPSSS
jgi:O-antigen ligase